MRTNWYIGIKEYNCGMDRFRKLLSVAEFRFESNDVGHEENGKEYV